MGWCKNNYSMTWTGPNRSGMKTTTWEPCWTGNGGCIWTRESTGSYNSSSFRWSAGIENNVDSLLLEMMSIYVQRHVQNILRQYLLVLLLYLTVQCSPTHKLTHLLTVSVRHTICGRRWKLSEHNHHPYSSCLINPRCTDASWFQSHLFCRPLSNCSCEVIFNGFLDVEMCCFVFSRGIYRLSPRALKAFKSVELRTVFQRLR